MAGEALAAKHPEIARNFDLPEPLFRTRPPATESSGCKLIVFFLNSNE